MNPLSIIKAEYIGGYKVKLFFNDKKTRVVDFGHFLSKNNHPQYDKYKKETLFKKYKIVNGNIVWGKDWDLIFPIYDLYKGTI